MTRIVQEKFQVRMPQNHNDEESGWISDKQARAKKNTPGAEDINPNHNRQSSGAFYNSLPPGMDVEDQEMTDQRRFATVVSGESDVSKDFNEGAIKKGYTRRKMLTTDDEYTNEHTDIFYGEANVDGEVGFVERGNMLDRL